MNCYRCGAELPEGAKVCAVCGTPVDEEKISENTGGAKLSAKKVTIIAAAMAVVALAVVIVVGKSVDVRHDLPPEPEPKKMEHEGEFIRLPASLEATSEVEESMESESETEIETVAEVGAEEGWISVVDRYKMIECVIPKSFERVRDDWGVTILNSKEGEASIRIAVIEGTQFENAADALALMRSELAGCVEVYAQAGEDWYETEFIDGRMTIHRKCFVESDALRYFEFRYPTERVEYRENISYMMENFKLTEAKTEEEEETVISD